jgi:hypothetical protein
VSVCFDTFEESGISEINVERETSNFNPMEFVRIAVYKSERACAGKSEGNGYFKVQKPAIWLTSDEWVIINKQLSSSATNKRFPVEALYHVHDYSKYEAIVDVAV